MSIPLRKKSQNHPNYINRDKHHKGSLLTLHATAVNEYTHMEKCTMSATCYKPFDKGAHKKYNKISSEHS